MSTELPLIMPVIPGTISDEDKNKLESAGIIVIVTESPEKIRLVSPTISIQGNAILSDVLKRVSVSSQSIKSDVADIFIDAFVKVASSHGESNE